MLVLFKVFTVINVLNNVLQFVACGRRAPDNIVIDELNEANCGMINMMDTVNFTLQNAPRIALRRSKIYPANYTVVGKNGTTYHLPNWFHMQATSSEGFIFDVRHADFLPFNHTCAECVWASSSASAKKPFERRHKAYPGIAFVRFIKDREDYTIGKKIVGMSYQSRMPPVVFDGALDVPKYQPTTMKVYIAPARSASQCAINAYSLMDKKHRKNVEARLRSGSWQKLYELKKTDKEAATFKSGYDFRLIKFNDPVKFPGQNMADWACILVYIDDLEEDKITLIRNIRFYHDLSKINACPTNDIIIPKDYCSAKPCQNGGACENSIYGYSCSCESGFSGSNCQSNVNECLNTPNLCHNGATCRDTHGGYTCDCQKGFTGDHCKDDIDECDNSPCENGGECVNTNGAYWCMCKDGFEGFHCEEDVDECLGFPCSNGGTCSNIVGGYNCICPEGVHGEHCEDDVNECLENPCQNGGNCHNTVGGYSCTCDAGYHGKHCELDVNECLATPCQNGGDCENSAGGYHCSCKLGFEGTHCQNDVNECLKNPCKNGATCTNNDGGYTCTCASGYHGPHCEDDVNECLNNPCQNGGECNNLVGGYSCVCASGFAGAHCDSDINECMQSPCQNGGICSNLVGGYSCSCASGYQGGNCETDVDECLQEPCQNGATCVNLAGGFRCDCASGFEDKTCSKLTDRLCDSIRTCSGKIKNAIDSLENAVNFSLVSDGGMCDSVRTCSGKIENAIDSLENAVN